MPERAPVVIVSGYLGAGKTTFLREIVPLLIFSPRPPYVILNDFMNAEIDCALLREISPDVRPVSGGCVCCDSSATLFEELEKIPRQFHPIVFIEANGTTDPFPLIELLTLDAAIAANFGPVYQVTLIDESRWQKRRFAWDGKIERAQAATASHLIANRGETASPGQKQRVKSDLTSLNPRAVHTTPADFVAELLALSSESTASLNPAAPIGHEHHHLALRLDLPPMREDILVRWLRSFPPEVLRIKGLVRLLDDPTDDACFFQRTDDEWGKPSLIKTFMPEGADSCAVLIGNGMDETKIRKSLDGFFYQPVAPAASGLHGIPSIERFLASRCK